MPLKTGHYESLSDWPTFIGIVTIKLGLGRALLDDRVLDPCAVGERPFPSPHRVAHLELFSPRHDGECRSRGQWSGKRGGGAVPSPVRGVVHRGLLDPRRPARGPESSLGGGCGSLARA